MNVLLRGGVIPLKLIELPICIWTFSVIHAILLVFTMNKMVKEIINLYRRLVMYQ